VFENRVLDIFGLKRDEVTGDLRELHMSSFIIYTPHQVLLGQSDEGG
jgi:hypothetical protein